MDSTKKSSFLYAIGSFFPVHIVFSHLKYNLISLFYWTFLFLVVSDSVGSAFGVPYLFLSPEYLGKINSISFSLLGFSLGGFTMAFNTYSYMKLGPRYPFLATISRPFFKFCINNSLIPSIFLIYYLYQMIVFQRNEELADVGSIIIYIVSFLLGFTIFIVFSILYFFPTTREKGEQKKTEETSTTPIQSVIQHEEKWYDYFRIEKQRNYYYIGKGFKIFYSRKTEHLDKKLIEHIFAQNRINASIFEILLIISFIISGQFIDYPTFEFPAAMSVVLLLTIVHMLFSALISWFHRWTYPILFAVMLIMNYLSEHTPFFNYTNYSYGLSYEVKDLKPYTIKEIVKNETNRESYEKSTENFNQLLTNWKNKIGQNKPKLVIVNVSGGGSRSALWTLTVLQKCDKIMEGKLSNHIQMITGASGGMVGAAYFRELLLRHHLNEIKNPYFAVYRENLGKDILNKLSFSASTNDLFFRYQKFSYNNHEYTKDRGYAFESQLIENLNGYLDHPLGYYENYEKKAQIPLMIMSPTIVNDGRRLLISSQSLSFMTQQPNIKIALSNSFENIDYQTFFAKNDPQHMRFTSALRSNATFPFIMPMVTMPTEPEMQLMDAGIRDNYGRTVTVNYLFALKDWIKKNTSGVVIK